MKNRHESQVNAASVKRMQILLIGGILMTPHRQEEEKKRVPTHVRVVVDVHCPVCGASFDDIVRNGRAGCAECYHTFSDRLKPMIERIHGEAIHRGKAPGANLHNRGRAASWW